MIRTVPPSRPADLLRASSDQIRHAAALLAELTADTAPETDGRVTRSATLEAGRSEVDHQTTILKAQRSFVAGLRLAQVRDADRELERAGRPI